MPGRAIVLALVAVIVFVIARSSEATDPGATSISPDKKWEYTCKEFAKDQCAPEIVNIATKDIVVDLRNLPSGRNAPDARIVWAPDSQSFGFNHSPAHAPHTSFKTTALYQLRDNQWVPMDSLIDVTSQRSQLWQLARRYSPKNTRGLSKDPSTTDILTVRKWTDPNTVILDASDGEAKALFTLKFDAKGKWRIANMHRMSKAEMEKADAEK